MNPAFSGAVKNRLHETMRLFRQMKVNDIVYVSDHLTERMVERNVDPVDIARMSVPVIKAFRETTYNDRTFVVFWRNLKLVASIKRGVVTDQRKIILKTIIDPEVPFHQYDTEIRI
jgi:hypothetical protein